MSYRAVVRSPSGGWLARGEVCRSRAAATALARSLSRSLALPTGVVETAGTRVRNAAERDFWTFANTSFWFGEYSSKQAAAEALADAKERERQFHRSPWIRGARVVRARLVRHADGTLTVDWPGMKSANPDRLFSEEGTGKKAGLFRLLESQPDGPPVALTAWLPFRELIRRWTEIARRDRESSRNAPNPGRRSAAAVLETFTGKPATRVRAELLPDLSSVARLGRAVELVYRSPKWDGKTRDYVHRFGSKVELLSDATGKVLLIRGGRLSVGARGLTG